MNVKKRFYRVSLSSPSGKKHSENEWRLAAQLFLKGIGVSEIIHDWILVLHDDTDHQHCHLTVARLPHSAKPGIRGGTGIWSPPLHDFRKAQSICQKISLALNWLSELPQVNRPGSPDRNISIKLKSWRVPSSPGDSSLILGQAQVG
jgi:hypothetical protein